MEIFDMFDGLCPEDLPLDESPIDPSRVLGLVRAEVRGTKKKPRRLGRAVRTALIAAALAAFLGVTAYAAYELFIDKYVIDQPAYYETEAQTEDRTGARISLTGYQGTPEYAAHTEWEAWQSDWWEKAREQDPWQARGVDDSWHETPDNYAYLYGASFQDQADALDAIVEKYGLTLHQDVASYYRSKDLYEALGTEPFFGEPVAKLDEDWDVSGYIYDDGSFKAEFEEALPDDRTASIQMFVNAKGSFADISGVAELSEDGEAWQYATASGRSVDLYLAPRSAEIMTESEGAYMEMGVLSGSAAGVTREDLQTIADSVDFAVLADRFDGALHPETADMLPVLRQREKELFPMPDAETEEYQAWDAASREVIDELGIFDVTQRPGYEDAFLSGHRLEHQLPWTEQSVGDQVTRQYLPVTDGGTAGQMELSWYRFYADGERTTSTTAEALTEAREYYEGQGYSMTELNGGEGFAFADGTWAAQAAWYDAEWDLLFMLDVYDAGMDADGVAELAATVAVQPAPQSTPIPLP